MAVVVLKLLVFFTMVCFVNVQENVSVKATLRTVINPKRKTLTCYACRGLRIEQCQAVTTKCRPEQNRCLSFLIEGAKGPKYYKRCGRFNECGTANLYKGCAKLRKVVGGASCRPACCNVNLCNPSSKLLASWVTVIVLFLGVLKVIS